jgi:hypothetical protein
MIADSWKTDYIDHHKSKIWKHLGIQFQIKNSSNLIENISYGSMGARSFQSLCHDHQRHSLAKQGIPRHLHPIHMHEWKQRTQKQNLKKQQLPMIMRKVKQKKW